ncbi:hypothetical protein [Bradyrhizobium canariense]|uniref:TolB amino-terminal domain-containing protein n=1 Tax=Bradyrhizobium canariense TaxID=255045 RepID=A0A1H1YQ11_9BRAD|nr:hypothetical protein [Bradyrhizobium canariense]SDT23477.1 TolB amino-terminal domain-containing protein [Bradyrhizobium canariense]
MRSEKTAGPHEGPDSDISLMRLPSEDEIRGQLARIVSNTAFATSDRPRRFLSYIVDQTLVGNSKRLKQYCIATEVLGRPSSFDPEIDPVVRLEAGKLRRAVENYYLRDGAQDPIVISIPKGSYVPTFSWPALSNTKIESANTLTATNHHRHNITWLPVPEFHRLAVLPFATVARDADTVEFSRGLHDQLVVELARYQELSVFVVDSLGEYIDPATAVLDIAKGFSSRFILSGSIRRGSASIRTTMRLHDATTSSILWSESFDADLNDEDRLAPQDYISRRVAGTVADYYGVISQQISLEAVYGVDRPWTINVAIQRHRYLAKTLAESAYYQARRDLDRAVLAAPHHSLLWAALAHTIFYGNVLGFQDDADWLSLVERYAQRAFELDHRCAYAHVVMALHRLYRGELDEVRNTCAQILKDNPHAPSTKLSAGFFTALAGDWNVGTGMIKEAMQSLLHPPAWPYRATFLSFYNQNNYSAALHELASYNSPESFTPPLLRAAALAQLGRISEARAAAREVLRLCPNFKDVSNKYLKYLVALPDLALHLREGIKKAGLLS